MHLMTLRDVCLKNWKISSCGAGVSFTTSLKLIADPGAWWNWATTNHQISIYRFIAKKEKPSCAAAMPCLWCWFASDLGALLEKKANSEKHMQRYSCTLVNMTHWCMKISTNPCEFHGAGVRSCAPAKPCHCWSRLNRLELDGEGQNSSRSEWNRYPCWISRDTRPLVWIFGYFLKRTARFASSQLTVDFVNKKNGMHNFLPWSAGRWFVSQVRNTPTRWRRRNAGVNWLFLDILLNQQ